MYIYKLISHKYTILKRENSFVSYNIFVLLLRHEKMPKLSSASFWVSSIGYVRDLVKSPELYPINTKGKRDDQSSSLTRASRYFLRSSKPDLPRSANIFFL